MNTIEVTVVRVYLTEGKAHMEALIKRLHDVEKVRGVTVFRGITGFGKHGTMHSSTLLDISLDLPLVVEFFDEPTRVAEVMEHLNQLVGPGHIVSWPARVNV